MHTITPGPRLAPFVERLWLFEAGAPAPAGATERVLPNGRMQLLVSLADPIDGARALVTGARAGSVEVPKAAMARILGASLRPGGAAAFIEAPAAAVAGHDVDLADLWGDEGRVLAERLAEGRTPTAILRRFEAALEARRRARRPDPLLAFALPALAGGRAVAEVVAASGASRATLVRAFHRAVGLSPKRWASVARFQRALGLLAAGAEDLAEVALAAGFFDQAHMTHAFRRHADLTPGAYRPLAVGRNHVAP